MATPDSRLFELITLLADVGADWLGLEILEGIRTGLAVEESRESLFNAQMAARFGHRPQIDKERALFFPLAQELHGDEQLMWAAAYVIERLSDEAEMLNAGFEQLNVLAIGREPYPESRDQNIERDAGVTLQIGEDGPLMDKVDIAALRQNLGDLSRALEDWLGTLRERR